MFPIVERDAIYWLIAGGIGITPILSMAYELDRKGKEFQIVLCARSQSRAALINEIKASAFCHRFRLYCDDVGEKFNPSEILRDDISRSAVYVCGPKPFMDFVTGEAARLGYSSLRVHTESFEPTIVEGERPFTVVAAKSGVSLEVLANKSIADTLEEAGIKTKISCEQGICGSCLTAVIDGVPDHRDLYQTAKEKERNDRIALCCSRAKTAQIVIDI